MIIPICWREGWTLSFYYFCLSLFFLGGSNLDSILRALKELTNSQKVFPSAKLTGEPATSNHCIQITTCIAAEWHIVVENGEIVYQLNEE